MEIYYFQLIIITCLSLLFFLLEKFNKKFNVLYGIITFIYLFSLLGNRAITVGTDTIVYYRAFISQNSYQNFTIPQTESDGIGRFIYDNLSRLIYNLTEGNYHIFLLVLGFLTIFTIYLSIYLFFGRLNYLSITMYMYLCFYLISFNTARQSLAMAITLLTLVLILNNRVKFAFVLSVFAIGIHSTAIVTILYYIFNVMQWNKKRILIAIPVIMISLSSMNFFIQIFINFFSHYQIYFQGTMDFSYLSFTNILRSVIFTIITLVSILVMRNTQKVLEHQFYLLFLITFLGNIIYVILYQSLLYTRIGQYFTIVNIIFIPYLFQKLDESLMNKYLKLLFKTLIIVISLILGIYSISINSGSIIPYIKYS